MGEAALKLEWIGKTHSQKAHKGQGKTIETCPKHGPKAVGPLVGAVCLQCQPFMAQPCGICRVPRFQCCC